MRKARTVLLLCVSLALVACGGAGSIWRADGLYQISTSDALIGGVYDGFTDLQRLLRQGDHGLGTFDALEGEMVVLDGIVYQVLADGSVREAPKGITTPFATVAFLQPEITFMADGGNGFSALCALLDRHRLNPNLFYLIRMDGEFEYIKTRSVPAQGKPYPPLAEVAKKQPVFEFNKVSGSIVGFWCPPFVQGVNIPGYHLHFLDSGRLGGGHLLEVRWKTAKVRLDAKNAFRLDLPMAKSFQEADLTKDRQKETRQVER